MPEHTRHTDLRIARAESAIPLTPGEEQFLKIMTNPNASIAELIAAFSLLPRRNNFDIRPDYGQEPISDED